MPSSTTKGSMHAERLQHLEIKLSDWIYRAITSSEVLPISRDYFRLRAPVDRRIYELARKHCGQQANWRVGLKLLQKKVGSKQAEKHFHAHVRNLVRSNHLPDYALTVESGQAVFCKRASREANAVQPSRRMAVAPSQRHDGQPALLAKADNAFGSESMRPPACVRISSEAFDRVPDLAPGWDRYALEQIYIAWASSKEAARNEGRPVPGMGQELHEGPAGLSRDRHPHLMRAVDRTRANSSLGGSVYVAKLSATQAEHPGGPLRDEVRGS